MPLATSTHGSTHGYLQPQPSSQPAPLQHSSPHAAGAIGFGFFFVFFLACFPLWLFFYTVRTLALSPSFYVAIDFWFFVDPPHASAWHSLLRTVGAALTVVLSVFLHVHVRVPHVHVRRAAVTQASSSSNTYTCFPPPIHTHISFFSLCCTQFVQQSRRHLPLRSPGGPCGTLRLTPHKVCRWISYTHTHTRARTHTLTH
jgi:hypothetical protein